MSRSKYLEFPIIRSLQYSININTVEVDPHSDLLHICIVKPKNSRVYEGRPIGPGNEYGQFQAISALQPFTALFGRDSVSLLVFIV